MGVSLRAGIACCALLLAACGREASGRYNVVLISIDSLRADRIGPYGHQPEFAPGLAVTPHLDRLAASGITFEDAWSTTSWTLPAHAALMTGLSDRAHGVEHDAFTLDPLHVPLAEAFQADGYVTGGAFSGPYLDPKYGFGRGFDDYASGMLKPDEFAAIVRTENEQRSRAGQPALRPEEIRMMRDRVSHWDLTSPRINAFALDFLERHADQRFFLFLHYFDAHYDYLPELGDAAAARAFDPTYSGDFHGEDWFFDSAQRVMTWPSRERPVGERRISERDLRHALALYDAEIHWVDRHVGAVLDRIAALGLEEDTIVVVLSDHGDEFFDHGSIAHRSTLYQELCRIPLIVRVPGVQSGQRVPHVARIYDVGPSLLDWCGLPPLPGAQGRPLRAQLGPEADGRSALSRIYARFNRDVPLGHNVREAFRDERYTVVRHLRPLDDLATPEGIPLAPFADPRSNREVLVFDRVADPRELRPLAASDPRWREAVQAFAAAWEACERETAALSRSPLVARHAESATAEEKATLGALGYANQESEETAGLGQLPLLTAPSPSTQLVPPR